MTLFEAARYCVAQVSGRLPADSARQYVKLCVSVSQQTRRAVEMALEPAASWLAGLIGCVPRVVVFVAI